MHPWFRRCSLMLALSLAMPVFQPSVAQAENDPTNEVVAFGLLGAVIGIVVYVGWKMDQEDRLYYTDGQLLRQALADTEDRGQLRLLSPQARDGEQIAGLGYQLIF